MSWRTALSAAVGTLGAFALGSVCVAVTVAAQWALWRVQ